ncbi:CU044_5270 family protein [Streptomyces sp. NPDC057336]|uniref:CU044_5270 family protein n=1 Tax=Streptomyces sp. NPDC057336 TaxID=3346102 RepID=UPI003637CE94
MTPKDPRGFDCFEYEETTEPLPAPGDPMLGPDRRRVLREHLMGEIARKRVAAPRRLPGRRLVVWAAAPLALAATVVTGTVVVTGLQGGREAVHTQGRSATTVGRPGVIAMSADQFLYKRRVMTGEYTDHRGAAEVVQREDWLAVSGGRDGLALTGPRPVAGDRLDPDSPTTEHMAMSGGSDFRELRELPTDPRELLAYVYRETEGQGPTPEEAVFEYIAGVVEPATLVPGLGEALYGAARRIPGVVVEHGVRDVVGRTGTGLALPRSRRDGRALVFDVSTFVFLGVEETTALLEIGVAERAGAPPARSWEPGP